VASHRGFEPLLPP